MNLVLSGPVDPTLLNLAVQLTRPREVVQLHANAHRLIGADDGASSRDEIERLCAIARVDHAFVPEGLRFSDFKLLAMDMDSTLITIECIDEIADFAGKKKEVAAITEAAMRGEIPDFAESLRRRVALLAGTPEDVLEKVWNNRLRLTAGAAELISKSHQFEVFTILLSGGFDYFANRLRAELDIDLAFSNTLSTLRGYLTGDLTGPILDANGKSQKVKETLQLHRYDFSKALAIGDGANDIPMMQTVGTSIAFRSSAYVQSFATYNIKYGTLHSVLDYFLTN